MKFKNKNQAFDMMFSTPNEDWEFDTLTYSNYVLRDGDLVIGEYIEDIKKYVFYLCKAKDELTTAQKALKKYLRGKFNGKGSKSFMKNCEVLTDWTISKNVNIELITGTHANLYGTQEWWLKDKTELQ